MTTLNEKISIAIPGTVIVIPKPREEETLIGLYHSHTISTIGIEIICDPAARIFYDKDVERLTVETHWKKPRTMYPFNVTETDKLLIGEEAYKEMQALGIGDYMPIIKIMQQFWEARKTMMRHELAFINFYALVPEQETRT